VVLVVVTAVVVGVKKIQQRFVSSRSVNVRTGVDIPQQQWHCQDLLRGGAIGAKLEIRSWGTHGGLQGRVQQLLDD